MGIYILKLSACLLVFWLLYVLLLEKQSTHQFKRFYLLGVLLASATIPLLSITTYIDPLPIVETPQTLYVEPVMDLALPEPEPEPLITLSTLLWSLYVLGVTFFGLRFMFNLSRLIKKIRSHKRIRSSSFIYVLLNKALAPHSFFKYLFFNKEDYYHQRIPKEVLIHEQTHAKQLHSLDILFIELLQIALWFNPLIYLIKHHIKLNHEFLADRAVLNQGVSTNSYQNTLLNYLSHQHPFQFSSSIHYSSLKKRITVMNTKTSRNKSILVHLLLIPVVSLLFFSFAERKTEFAQLPKQKNPKTKAIRQATTYVYFDSLMGRYNDISFEPAVPLRDAHQRQTQSFESSIYVENPETRDDLTQSVVGMFSGVSPHKKNSASTNVISVLINSKEQFLINNRQGDYTSFQELIESIDPKTHVLIDLKYDKNTSIELINKVKTLINNSNIKFITNQNYFEELPLQQRFSTQDSVDSYLRVYETYQKLKAIPPYYKDKSPEDQNKLDALYSVLGSLYFKLSNENKAKVKPPKAPFEPYVKITINGETYYKKRDELTAEEKASLPPPPRPKQKTSKQLGATQAQIAEYNIWAKLISEQNKKAKEDKGYPYPIIKVKDLNKFEKIYKEVMTSSQREQALPWPKIVPAPPPPPLAPKKQEIKNYLEKKPPSPSPNQPYAQNTNKKVIMGADAYLETPTTPGLSAANGTSYLIKNIIVTGNSEFNDNTIITFSKLKKGEIIAVGGEKIKSAVSRLWSSNLFKSIDIYLVNTDGDKTDVEIHVIDRPKDKELKTQPPPPLQHIKEMAQKKGAVFYFEGKEISSEAAIDLVSKNQSLHIKIDKKNAEGPIIYLFKMP